MSYWTKKNNYKENKPSENIIKVWNDKTKTFEFIKLTDFINSYGDFKNEINKKEILENNEKIFKDFKNETEKIINLRNITEEKEASESELKEKENIKKLYKYINELKEKENN